jgi:hypothetical protein
VSCWKGIARRGRRGTRQPRKKEFVLRSTPLRWTARITLAAALFSAGYLSGSLGQRNAEAQGLKDLGAAAKQAAGSGALGSAAELGTSILEMQEHVSGLQKNLDTLKKIQAALGG